MHGCLQTPRTSLHISCHSDVDVQQLMCAPAIAPLSLTLRGLSVEVLEALLEGQALMGLALEQQSSKEQVLEAGEGQALVGLVLEQPSSELAEQQRVSEGNAQQALPWVGGFLPGAFESKASESDERSAHRSSPSPRRNLGCAAHFGGSGSSGTVHGAGVVQGAVPLASSAGGGLARGARSAAAAAAATSTSSGVAAAGRGSLVSSAASVAATLGSGGGSAGSRSSLVLPAGGGKGERQGQQELRGGKSLCAGSDGVKGARRLQQQQQQQDEQHSQQHLQQTAQQGREGRIGSRVGGRGRGIAGAGASSLADDGERSSCSIQFPGRCIPSALGRCNPGALGRCISSALSIHPRHTMQLSGSAAALCTRSFTHNC